MAGQLATGASPQEDSELGSHVEGLRGVGPEGDLRHVDRRPQAALRLLQVPRRRLQLSLQYNNESENKRYRLEL